MFVTAIEVGFAVDVYYGRSKPLPYPKLFVSAVEVRLAVTVLNGASRTSPPTAICLFM